MIGQEKLRNVFRNYTLDTMPHSIMLVGEEGCGKHTLVDMLSTNLNVEQENITSKLTYEKLVDIMFKVDPCIYVVDGMVSELAQNSLLKFLEEPPKLAYVIILAESEYDFLPTICGRCSIMKMEEYSDEELAQFTNSKELIQITRSPGKLIELSKEENKWVFELNDKIRDCIGVASIPNSFILQNKFNFGKEEGKFSIDLEMKLLRRTFYLASIGSEHFSNAYFTTKDYCEKFLTPNVDKRKLFLLYLLDLKRCVRNNDGIGY